MRVTCTITTGNDDDGQTFEVTLQEKTSGLPHPDLLADFIRQGRDTVLALYEQTHASKA